MATGGAFTYTGSCHSASSLHLTAIVTTTSIYTADRVLNVRPWLAATIRCANTDAGGDAAPSPRSAVTAPAQDGTLFEAQEVELLLSFARSSTRAAACAAAAGGAAGEQDGGAGGSLARLPSWWEPQLWDPTYVYIHTLQMLYLLMN